MKKSTIPSLHITLADASKSRSAGGSLAGTLYGFPVDILLTGDLGAGKTTFLQGFAEKLGISDHITSPTYALEQRYEAKNGMPVIHVDLYRLKEKDAHILIETTDEHEGIRCIEWADRLPGKLFTGQSIHLHFEELKDGRTVKIIFDDCPIPTEKQIEDWRAEVMLPAHITRHCETVARIAGIFADHLIERGEIVRKDAVIAAAKLHDLLRFLDFKGVGPQGIQETKEEAATWEKWKQHFSGLGHEDGCAAFLRERGYSEIATIIEPHGLKNIERQPVETTEQKILFYADKRAIVDRIVTVAERFDDFAVRYASGGQTEKQRFWLAETMKVERELFPDGVPEIN